MVFKIESFRFYVLPVRTRFPFRYGIASMTALPHLFVNVDMVVDGKAVTGLSSEGLPPKWFTKDAQSPFEVDLAEMLAVVQNASRIARLAALGETAFFAWWQALATEQRQWAAVRQCPPLLAGLGVSLIERAVLDGLCKACAMPLHELLRGDVLRIDLGAMRAATRGVVVRDVIAEKPLPQVMVRHTVGLGDALRASELGEDEKIQDGLPQALDESIRAYGLRFFKIKLCGRAEADVERLRQITAVLTAECVEGFQATLDGNEQFESLEAFFEFFAQMRSEAALKPLLDRLIFIEQPLHRRVALDDEVAALRGWADGPGVIIDESDGSLDDLPRALELGYCGTSHKNCKGILKGLANAALLRSRPGSILSGEDLANIGPVALLQDLAVMALLGVQHVERNGHHYFRGLSAHPEAVQAAVLTAHSDLYERHPLGYATLRISQGGLSLKSVNAAPLGCAVMPDMAAYEPLNDWIKRGGLAEF